MAGEVQVALDMRAEGPLLRLLPRGSWTVREAADLDRLFADIGLPSGTRQIRMDLEHVTALDTAGAWVLVRSLAGWRAQGLDTGFGAISDTQAVLLGEVAAHPVEGVHPAKPEPWALQLLEDTGRTVAGTGSDAVRVTAYLGAVVAALGRIAMQPRRFRMTSVIHHLEHAGLRAVGIIGLMSFLIGGIIAQQGAFQLRKFGAELFVVDLVGILVLRELGVLMTAIMFAGRSGSAFTAELGSMKMREEIDAMRIIGLDPVETLIVPRLLALVLALPLVTVLADIACITGAGLVAKYYMEMSPDIFLSRLREAVSPHTFYVGLFKAPFMALVIGLIASVEGMKVKGSAESLGRQTTASVVKSIFMVIVLDGFFAVFFAAVDW